jgi:hypothetical protein
MDFALIVFVLFMVASKIKLMFVENKLYKQSAELAKRREAVEKLTKERDAAEDAYAEVYAENVIVVETLDAERRRTNVVEASYETMVRIAAEEFAAAKTAQAEAEKAQAEAATAMKLLNRMKRSMVDIVNAPRKSRKYRK